MTFAGLSCLGNLSLFASEKSGSGSSDSIVAWRNINWSAPPIKGEHPRVLFTKKDIPLIRNNAKTKIGKQLLSRLKWEVNSPASNFIKKFKNNEKISGNYDKVAKYAFFAALLHTITGERKYLEAGTDLLRICSDKLGPVSDKPVHVFARGADCLVLAYDILYDYLPKTLRNKLSEHFLSWLDPKANRDHYLSYGYEMGPVRCGRPCDWGAISAGGAAIAYCAMEEEVPAGKKAIKPILKMLRHLANYAIYPEGHMLSGNGYIGGDFSDFFNAGMALKKRGMNLFDHPNLKMIPIWLAYETIPNGYIFDNRNQSAGFIGINPSIVSMAANYDGCAKWVQFIAMGPEQRIVPNPEGAAVALIYGSFEELIDTPPKLPLTYYSSSMGTVFSRSGWGDNASTFTITMEPPGGGHTHADKGSFTFYSHGIALAADGGSAKFSPKDHNTILIDGRGQQGGQGMTDAIVRTQLASDFADITKMDVKPAFENILAYTNNTKEKVNWRKLKFGKGLPFHWKRKNSFERIDRFAIYVRGKPESYAVVIDEIKKDSQPHNYTWLLQSALPGKVTGPGEVEFTSRSQDKYLESKKNKKWTLYEGELQKDGIYNIWLLARTRPDVKQAHWFLSYMVNKESYRSYLSHSSQSWQWILLKKKGKIGTWNLRGGELKVRLRVKRGGQFAQVLVTPDLKFKPNMALKQSTKDKLILTLNESSLGDFWALSKTPGYVPRLNVNFIQPDSGKLTITCAQKPKQPYLYQMRATQSKTVRADFAVLLLPENLNSKKRAKVIKNDKHPGAVIIRTANHTDYLYVKPESSLEKTNYMETDAKFALVRVAGGKIIKYLMVEGTSLSFKDKSLVKSDGGSISIVKGLKSIAIQAPQKSRIKFLSRKSRKLICNNQPLGEKFISREKGYTIINVPVLPSKWEIDISKDGLTVTVVGDAPQPLKIHAPKAIKCVVNGISRFFSLDAEGNIYPKLEISIPTHGRNPYKAEGLK